MMIKNLLDKVSAKKENITKTKALIIFIYICLFIISISTTYIVLARTSLFDKSQTEKNQVRESIRESEAGFVNILLLGHGDLGHQGSNLMDAIILVSVNPKQKTATLISVPRDLWIEGRKINEGYVDGGFDLLKHQVNTVTGILPEYLISIDFNAYKRAIGLIGGITIDAPKAYDDYFYPIRGKELDICGKSPEEMVEVHQKYSGFELEKQFECRYEHVHFDQGKNEMQGEDALKYVRSRHGDGDFGRSERQFVVLVGIKDKLLSFGEIEKWKDVFDTLVESVETNIKPSEIDTLVEIIGNAGDYNVTKINLTDQNVLTSGKSSAGAYILLPREGEGKWGGVIDFINESAL